MAQNLDRKYRYRVVITWSDEDGAYLASAPQLPGCTVDGATPEEALSLVFPAIQDWLETAREMGWKVPEPLDDVAHERAAEEKQRQLHESLRQGIHAATAEAIEQLLAQGKLKLPEDDTLFPVLPGHAQPASR